MSEIQCNQCGQSYPLADQQQGCPVCQLQMGLSGTTDAAPLASFIEPQQLSAKFDDLEVLDLIGCGGMGAVYTARQKKLDRIVALKVVRPDISDSAEFAQRFEREAQALARLNHPNIVSIFDFGQRDDLFYYIMEYVDGTNLAELSRQAELSPTESLEIVTQVCKAMQYAHESGVVHRDIKPTNILLNAEGTVKIADFGLAKFCESSDPRTQLTQTRQVFGTPRYMAPEQIESTREVDHRADIYSLGVVFYELLTGELPLGRFDPPSQRVEINVKLDEVVLRALEKHPERRYQTVRQFQSDISQFSAHNQHHLSSPIPTTTPSRLPAGKDSLPFESDLSTERWVPSSIAFLTIASAVLGSLGMLGVLCMELQPNAMNPFESLPKVFKMTSFSVLLIMLAGGGLVGARVLYRREFPELVRNQEFVSPVRRLFSLRVLAYASLVCAILLTGIPWFAINHQVVSSALLPPDFSVLACATWLGALFLIAALVGLGIACFIDLYEGPKIQFGICILIVGIALMACSIPMANLRLSYRHVQISELLLVPNSTISNFETRNNFLARQGTTEMADAAAASDVVGFQRHFDESVGGNAATVCSACVIGTGILIVVLNLLKLLFAVVLRDEQRAAGTLAVAGEGARRFGQASREGIERVPVVFQGLAQLLGRFLGWLMSLVAIVSSTARNEHAKRFSRRQGDERKKPQ